MKPLHQRAFSLTSVRVLHLRLKLHFTDTNDRGGSYHISSSDICIRTHRHLQGLFCYFLWLRACVHLMLDRAIPPSRHATALLPSLLLPPPYFSPCNLTLSALVSRLHTNRDCSRPGLDFPVLTSPLLCFICQEYLHTHSSSTHSCFSPPPYPPFSCEISKNMCVFRKHTSLMFPLLSLLKSHTFFSLSNLRFISLRVPAARSNHGRH